MWNEWKKWLEQQNIDAFLISKKENVSYVSAFSGADSFALLLRDGRQLFLTDARYDEQAMKECLGWEVINYRKDHTLISFLSEFIRTQSIKSLAFESHVVSYQFMQELTVQCGNVSFRPMNNVLEEVRSVKTEEEIKHVEKAAGFADRAFAVLLNEIKPGRTEKELAARLEYELVLQGSEGSGFPTILVSGKNSSMPHGIPSDKPIEKGDLVTIDFGGCYKGYRSDMTRTLVIGKPTLLQRDRYQAVLESQEAGIAQLIEGHTADLPDSAVREVLKNAHLEDYYYPGLGHGLGLEIHEIPFLRKDAESILKRNQLITVEPGIYFPGWGGIRIEDTVLITANTPKCLTLAPKELISL